MVPEYSKNVYEHTSEIKKEFTVLTDHLRMGILEIEDPGGKALFEVCAEVIGGLRKAFEDYERGNEPVWT